jgi:cytochrome c-type biogenesis protein CcmH
METVDWIPPILMLAAGLVVGVIVLAILSRRKPSAAAAAPVDDAAAELDLELRDLEAKREGLILQLREMEDTASKLEPEQLAAARWDTELATARVLREIDRLTGKVQAPAARRAPVKPAVEEDEIEESGPPRGIKGFVWGVASAAALGALVIFVSQSMSDRDEGGSLTGGPQMSGRQAQQAADPELQQAIAAVNARPDDIEARVGLAYEYLLREDFMQVFEQTQLVLERDPNEPRAMTYQALVRLAMGQDAVAGQMLERAVALDPTLMDARVYLGLSHARSGRFDEAKAQIEAAKKDHPDQAMRLDQVALEFEAMRAEGGMPRPAPTEDPHASLLPPPPTGEVSPVVAGPGVVTGTITLADGVRVQSGAVVFVIARAVGGAGPAVAVARITPSSFPVTFTLSAANSMMGEPLPDRMRVEARIDLDGDVMTRDAGAPTGFVDDVAAGATGVTIVLR